MLCFKLKSDVLFTSHLISSLSIDDRVNMMEWKTCCKFKQFLERIADTNNALYFKTKLI
jgi:hypothetical protein